MPKGKTTTLSAAEMRDVGSLRQTTRNLLADIESGGPVTKRERDKARGTLDRLDAHEAKREARGR